jgi:hypothetical protein
LSDRRRLRQPRCQILAFSSRPNSALSRLVPAVVEEPASSEYSNPDEDDHYMSDHTTGYPIEGSSRFTTHPPDHELKDVDFDKIFSDYEATINDLYTKTEDELDELQGDSDDSILEQFMHTLQDTIRESYCPHYPIEHLQAVSTCLFRIDNFNAGKVDPPKEDPIGLDNEGLNWIFDENKLVGTMWKEKDPNHMKKTIVDMYRRKQYPNLEWYYFCDLITEVWEEDGEVVDLDRSDPGSYQEGENGNDEDDGDNGVDDEEEEEDEEDEEEEEEEEEEEDDDDDDEEEEEEEDEEEEEEVEEEESSSGRVLHTDEYSGDLSDWGVDPYSESWIEDEPPPKRVRR